MSEEQAIDVLRDVRRLVILTGAGVSTESGVPDFRSDSGLWQRFDPDEFRYERFLRDPQGFWELRARLMQEMDLARAKPNAAHVAIADASRGGRLLGHVTQNIDGLFQTAGHAEEKLVEIHGSARKVRCIACARFFSDDGIDLAPLPPTCAACGGVLKPGTILFGEMLHAPDLARAEEWFRHADAVLAVGTSLVVHPVAALPALALARGAVLVIMNRDPTPYDGEADAIVRERAGVAVPRILATASRK